MILLAGGGGLSVAFDMPTLMGRDSDDPIARRGRPLRRGRRLRRRHGRPVRRHPAGRRHHVDDDQRTGGADLLHVPRRGGAPGRRSATSTAPCRPTSSRSTSRRRSGCSRPSPHLRLIGDLMEFCAEQIPGVQAAVGLRLPHPGGRLDGRAGAGVHRWRTGSATSSWASRAASTWTSSRPACPSSSTRTSTSSRRSPSSAPPAGSGPGGCATCTALDRTGAVAALPHPDRRRIAHGAAAGQQRRADRGRGAGRGARRHQLAAHQRAGRGARAAQRDGRRDRAAHPAGAHRGDRRGQRGRPAGRLVVRRGAHRPHRGRGGGDLRRIRT